MWKLPGKRGVWIVVHGRLLLEVGTEDSAKIKEKKTMGWGGGSLGQALATQPRGPVQSPEPK